MDLRSERNRGRRRRAGAAALRLAAIATFVLRPDLEGFTAAAALLLAARGVRWPRVLSTGRFLLAARFAAAGVALVGITYLASARWRPEWHHDLQAHGSMAVALVGLVVLAVLVLPTRDLPFDADDLARAGRVCEHPDSDLMAPFSLGHEKRFVFSTDGRAAVGYRTVGGVSVAGPGPVGATDAAADALARWLDRCDERGWRPFMIGADTRVRQLCKEFGLHGLSIGDEVISQVDGFRLDTPAMRNARQAVQRTRNSGVTVTIRREGELDRDLHGELIAVAEEWQRGKGGRGFSMTLDHLLDGTHPHALLAIAHHEGRVVGFQRYLPCRNGRGLTLDVMPRRRRAPNGVNERLIVETVHWSAAHGVEQLSLNFAAFRDLFESAPTPSRRVARRVVHLLDPFLNVESLYRFNAKFHPRWNERHVVFQSVADLPFVLYAALRLEFGRHASSAETGDATAGMATRG